jgi:regulatory protein CII
MDELHDTLDAAAKGHPIKALAPEIGKAESSLRNELTQQPGYKLGLVTAIQIMKTTKNLKALDRIETMFNRVAFEIPRADSANPVPLMRLMAELSKEFAESISACSDAWKDGIVTKAELTRCQKENRDLIEKAIQLEANLEAYAKE